MTNGGGPNCDEKKDQRKQTKASSEKTKVRVKQQGSNKKKKSSR